MAAVVPSNFRSETDGTVELISHVIHLKTAFFFSTSFFNHAVCKVSPGHFVKYSLNNQ